MITRTARVALNTFSNLSRFAISIGVVFLLTPYIIKQLGQEEFGLWSLTFAILGFLSLLDMGFGSGVIKFVAECNATGEMEKRNEILSTLWVTYLVLGLISLISVLILSLFYDSIFQISENLQTKAIWVLWLLALRSSALSLPLGLYRGILFGKQLIWQINLVQAGTNVLYGLSAWYVLANDYGIIYLAAISLLSMLVEHIIYVILVYVQVEDLKIRFSLAKLDRFKELTSFSIFTFIVSISSLILLRTDPLIIKLFYSLSAVAIYSIALKIVENTHLFSKQFINVLSPLISELKAQNDHEKLRFALINCARFALVPSMLLSIPIFCFARETLTFWLGAGFDEAVVPLYLLLIAMMAAVPQMLASSILTMTGHQKKTAKAAILSAIINLVASLLLVKQYGLVGVAAGTLIATLIVDVIIIPVIAVKTFSLTWSSYWYRILTPMLMPIILNFSSCLIVKNYYPATSILDIAFKSIPGFILFMLYWWYRSLEDSEKDLFRNRLLKFKKK